MLQFDSLNSLKVPLNLGTVPFGYDEKPCTVCQALIIQNLFLAKESLGASFTSKRQIGFETRD